MLGPVPELERSLPRLRLGVRVHGRARRRGARSAELIATGRRRRCSRRSAIERLRERRAHPRAVAGGLGGERGVTRRAALTSAARDVALRLRGADAARRPRATPSPPPSPRDGVRVFGRSVQVSTVRAATAAATGRCSCCAMRVDGLPGVRTCMTPVREGMIVEREHAWPSRATRTCCARRSCAAPAAARRLLLLAGSGARPAPGARPSVCLAHAAGQAACRRPRRSSGCAPGAARTRERRRARRGRRRRGRHERRRGGGRRRRADAPGRAPPGPRRRAADSSERGASSSCARSWRGTADGSRVLTGAEVAGWYEEDVLAVAAGDDLLLVEPGAVVLASGAHERVLPFVRRRPARRARPPAPRAVCCAAARLARRRALVVTDRADGYALAAELAAARPGRWPPSPTCAPAGAQRTRGPGARPSRAACRSTRPARPDGTRACGASPPSTLVLEGVPAAPGGRSASRATSSAWPSEEPGGRAGPAGARRRPLRPGARRPRGGAVPSPAARGPRLLLAGAANARGSAVEAAADGEAAGRAAAAIVRGA